MSKSNNNPKAAQSSDSPRRKTPLEILEEREHDPKYILKTMNPELRKVYEDLREWDEKELRRTILSRYELGQQLIPVEEDDGFRYGQEAMKKLSIALGWTDSLLYDALRFCRSYTREQAESLCEMRTSSGRPLTWTHIRALISLTAVERQEMLLRTLAEDWTTDNLAEQIAQAHPKKSGAQSPRLHVPRDLDAVIREQDGLAEKFLERADAVWRDESSLTQRFLELSPEEHTEERAQHLKGLAQKMRRLADEAEARASEAEKVYQRSIQAMAKRNVGAATELDDDDAATTDVADDDLSLGDDDVLEDEADDQDPEECLALAG